MANLVRGAHPFHGLKAKMLFEVVGNFINPSKKKKEEKKEKKKKTKNEVSIVSENPGELKKK